MRFLRRLLNIYGVSAGTAEISGQVISQKAVLSVYTFFTLSDLNHAMTANPHRINHQYSKRRKCWFIALSASSILSWQSSDDCRLLLILLIIQFVQAAIRSRVRESATRVAHPDAHKSSLRVSRGNSSGTSSGKSGLMLRVLHKASIAVNIRQLYAL